MATAPVIVTMLSEFTPPVEVEIGNGPTTMRNVRNVTAEQTPFGAAIRLLMAVLRG